MYAANYPISNYCRRVNSVFLFFFLCVLLTWVQFIVLTRAVFSDGHIHKIYLKIITLKNCFFFTINHAVFVFYTKMKTAIQFKRWIVNCYHCNLIQIKLKLCWKLSSFSFAHTELKLNVNLNSTCKNNSTCHSM